MSDRSVVLTQLAAVIGLHTGLPAKLTEETDLGGELALDSLDAVNIAIECEAVFNMPEVTEDDERLFQGKVGPLLDYIMEHRNHGTRS